MPHARSRARKHALSDNGSRLTIQWHSFLCKQNQIASTSRLGSCHANAVAESFFDLLKRERIRLRTPLNRAGFAGD